MDIFSERGICESMNLQEQDDKDTKMIRIHNPANGQSRVFVCRFSGFLPFIYIYIYIFNIFSKYIFYIFSKIYSLNPFSIHPVLEQPISPEPGNNPRISSGAFIKIENEHTRRGIF